MPNVTTSYGIPLHYIFFANFAHNWRIFMSKVLYLDYIYCVFDGYKHFNIMTCQMWLQILGYLLILLRFWVFLYIIDDHYSCLKCCIFTTLSPIICLINTHILICRHARCNYKLRKVLSFNWVLRKFQCLIP